MLSQVEKNIILSLSEYKDLKSYCDLNKFDENKVVKDSYLQGFRIEKYGLLSGNSPQVEPEIKYVEKEVVKYIDRPVEIIKEIEVIKEVEVVKEIIKEVPTPPTEIKIVEYVDREVVKEVPVEKIVEKIVNIYDNSEIDNLLKKIEELENRKPEIIEVVKEVPVEVIKEIVIEKNIQDDSKQKKLEQTLQSLKSENINKDRKIEELENKVIELEKIRKNSGAVYLRGSNLDETLYK
jgi:hypothetical protein